MFDYVRLILLTRFVGSFYEYFNLRIYYADLYTIDFTVTLFSIYYRQCNIHILLLIIVEYLFLQIIIIFII